MTEWIFTRLTTWLVQVGGAVCDRRRKTLYDETARQSRAFEAWRLPVCYRPPSEIGGVASLSTLRACKKIRLPYGAQDDPRRFPALNAPGYCQTPLRGANRGVSFHRAVLNPVPPHTLGGLCIFYSG